MIHNFLKNDCKYIVNNTILITDGSAKRIFNWAISAVAKNILNFNNLANDDVK